MHTLTTILAQASGNQEAAAVAFGATLMAFFAAFFLVFVVIGIVTLIGMWKVFTKAGEPGWAVLVPIYNLIVLLRIAGLPWYWVFTPLIVVIPLLGAIAYLVWIVWVSGFFYCVVQRVDNGWISARRRNHTKPTDYVCIWHVEFDKCWHVWQVRQSTIGRHSNGSHLSSLDVWYDQ